jgi:O-acetylserine/cysteine efflux transporter
LAQQFVNSRFGKAALLIALLINLIWALNWLVSKQLVDATSPFIAGAMRQTIVFIVCLPWLKRPSHDFHLLLVYAFFAGVGFFLLANMAYANSDNVGALAIGGQLGVPFVAILGWLFFDQTLDRRQLVGMTVAFFGVGILLFDPAIFSEAIGLMFITASSLAWAIPQLLQGKLIGRHAKIDDALSLVAWSGLAGTLILWPMAWLIEPASFQFASIISLNTLAMAIFSGLGAGVIANVAMITLIKEYGAPRAVPLTLPNIAMAVIASAWYFSRPITAAMIFGGLTVIAGLVILVTQSANEAAERY